MVLTMSFLLFRLSVSCLNIFLMWFSGSNYLNIDWKLHFSKIHSVHKFKTFCTSGLTFVALHVTLKQVFFSPSFSRYKSEKLIRKLLKY